MALSNPFPGRVNINAIAANTLLNRGYAAQNDAYSQLGTVLGQASTRIKGENTEAAAADVASITDLANFDQRKAEILAKRKGTNYNESATTKSLATRQLALQQDAEYQHKVARQPIVEAQQDAKSTSELLTNKLNQEKNRMAIAEATRLQRNRQLVTEQGNNILSNNILTNPDGTTSIDRVGVQNDFMKLGLSPFEANTQTEALAALQLQTSAESVAATRAANVDDAQLKQAVGNSVTNADFRTWYEDTYRPRIQAMGFSTEKDSTEQQKMTNLVDRFLPIIGGTEMQRILGAAVDEDGIARTGLRAMIPFLGLNKIEGQLQDAADKMAAQNISRNPYSKVLN